MTEPTESQPGFYLIRGVGKYDAIGYAIPKDEPSPLWPEPKQRWVILFLEDTPVGPATSAAYTTRTELAAEHIGPAIADLLRDAARYRWCRENITCWYIGECNSDNTAAIPHDFDALIDADIARASEGGDRG